MYSVGKFRIGGQLGQSPTWIVATVFYHGDKYLLSPSGEFDKKGLSEKIEEALSVVSDYKLVLGIDVVVPSEQAVHSVLSFLGDFKVPLLIEAASPEARAKSYLAARELGLTEYSIANGIHTDMTAEELEALRESKLGKAVALIFDPKDPYKYIQPENRVKLFEEKILQLAKSAGVDLILADFVVLDPGSIALCAEAIRIFKEKYSYPSGCAPANALSTVTKSTVTLDEMYGVHGGSAAYLRLKGADFVMVGPLSRVKYVAPVLAMIDGLLGYELRRRGVQLSEEHPIRGLLKKVQKLFTQPTLPSV